MTKGEYRVGIDFNPGGLEPVHLAKVAAAALIDSLQPVVDTGGEAARCAAIAQTKYEEACMWHVKALTKPKEEHNG